MIDSEGGVTAVLSALASNPEFDEHALVAMKFFNNLANNGYDMSKVMDQAVSHCRIFLYLSQMHIRTIPLFAYLGCCWWWSRSNLCCNEGK